MTRLLGAFRKELPATLIAACFVAACGASPVPGGDVGPDGGIRLTQHDGAGSDGGAIPDLVAELPEGTPDLVGCEPDCEGKACGDDGCGGWCGECPLGSFCIDGFCLTASQCEPDCAGLLCGGDGCGGLCGLCLGGEFCDLGICSSGSCEPDCDQMECGDDGCGGLCGTCPPGHNCLEGSCLCQVSCEGKACGDNGCGGSCGQCGPGLTCVGGQCLCEPDCTGKACGDNGCGGGCGSCLLGESCVGGTCKAGSCVPDCAGKSCGTDGCDGSCGSCLPNHVCTAGVCECLPSCGGKDCGDDGCGGDCGSCPPASICIANQCVCWPSCDGVDCGPDGCGGSCGSCPENAVCDGGKCADMLGKALDCGDGNCFDNCGPFDDPTLPGGRTSYVVALAKLSPDGSSWARLARYAFDPDGTVVETVWFWNYDSDTGKQEVDKSKSSCDKAACKVYAPARFPSGGGYPKTIKGVWSLTDKQLTVTWAIGATEMWTLNDRCDMVRLDLVDSNYGITHGVAYGSLSDAGLGLSVEDRMEGPDVLLQGPWARLKGDDYAEGVSSENFPGAWKACDKALAVKKYSTTSCNECDKGKTTKVRNYLAWKGGRMDAWELFCECLIPNAKCYNKKPRLRAFLQVLDDAGRFRGWVGIEASLYADAVDRMAWKVLVDDGACQPSCEGVPVGTPDGCGGLCGIGPPPPNNDPKRILVYTANVENLPKPDYAPESCAGDWQDLLHYMRTQAHAPDFLLVQQISDNGQLDYLAGQMEAMLGGDYGTIIAVKEPAYWDEADCSFKKHQANGIIYRKGRFTYVQGSKSTWSSKVQKEDGCQTAKSDRYVNVAGTFIDALSAGQKKLAVASIHWPVVDGCGVTNAQLVQDSLKGYSDVEMFLWGGDVNLPDLSSQSPTAGYKPWFEKANVELGQADNVGYRDAVWHHCDTTTDGEAALKQCLIDNGTLRFGVHPRYDYLFFKYANSYKPGDAANPPPADGVHTVDFDEAGAAQNPDDSPLPYSDHKAVRAYVHW